MQAVHLIGPDLNGMKMNTFCCEDELDENNGRSNAFLLFVLVIERIQLVATDCSTWRMLKLHGIELQVCHRQLFELNALALRAHVSVCVV